MVVKTEKSAGGKTSGPVGKNASKPSSDTAETDKKTATKTHEHKEGNKDQHKDHNKEHNKGNKAAHHNKDEAAKIRIAEASGNGKPHATAEKAKTKDAAKAKDGLKVNDGLLKAKANDKKRDVNKNVAQEKAIPPTANAAAARETPKAEPLARKESVSVLTVPTADGGSRSIRSSRLSVASTRRLSVESRRSVDYSSAMGPALATTVVMPAETEDKFMQSSSDDSYIKNAIPSLPIALAVICLILNIFAPGLGE